ncbi:MAG: peptidase, partial [Deltaproteobacteria bacterium]|nr:peptidase [Deltaproteobacteria bacterium]
TTAVTRYDDIDLIVTSVSGPASAISGTSITINYTAQNLGHAASGPTITHLYLSTNPANVMPGGSDIYLTSPGIPSIAGGASYSGSASVTLPVSTPSGTYYIRALADPYNEDNVETNENNNTGISTTTTSTF